MTSSLETVAFNVMDAKNYTGIGAIRFSKIMLNEGFAYSEDTGTFTAPSDGIYLFNTHICCVKEEDVDYSIYVAYTPIVTGEFRVPGGADDTKCTSASAVAMVRKGENVWVGGMSFSQLRRNDNDLTSFSGTLLKKL